MKTVFIKSWYKKDVKVINDFLHDNGHFLSHVSFQKTFELHICTMQYNSIVNTISSYLKSFLPVPIKCLFKRPFTPYIPLCYKSFLLQNKCTKPIYKQLIACKITPTAIPKWNSELVQNWVEICVYGALNVCFKTTNLFKGYNTDYFIELFL